MATTGLFNVLVTPELGAARDFYERHFRLRPVFVAEWYVHLASPELPLLQLGLVAAGHESVPPGDWRANRSIILTLQVDDVDASYRSMSDAGVPLLAPPRDEPWGQRHFFATDPAGFLIDVVTPIEPAAEYSAAYLGSAS